MIKVEIHIFVINKKDDVKLYESSKGSQLFGINRNGVGYFDKRL